jgi:hypothetical protein
MLKKKVIKRNERNDGRIKRNERNNGRTRKNEEIMEVNETMG